MKLLIDANLSPSITAGLAEAGFEAVHVGEVDLLTASDSAIVEYACANDLVVVTVDSDFAAMLAIEGAERPSVVQLREVAELGPTADLALLVANLGAVAEDIDVGAIVSAARPSRNARCSPVARTDWRRRMFLGDCIRTARPSPNFAGERQERRATRRRGSWCTCMPPGVVRSAEL